MYSIEDTASIEDNDDTTPLLLLLLLLSSRMEEVVHLIAVAGSSVLVGFAF
jgi:hypothetical protein